jgi:phosphopantetheine adenylyltransferase
MVATPQPLGISVRSLRRRNDFNRAPSLLSQNTSLDVAIDARFLFAVVRQVDILCLVADGLTADGLRAGLLVRPKCAVEIGVESQK